MLNLDKLPSKGQEVSYEHRGATFQMVVQNARIRYGQIDVEISPIAGGGSFWVRFDNLLSKTPVTESVTA